MTPIFMIGTQRSGSNLLRLMINQLDHLASPHPPHILERVYPLLDHYGDLDKKENFELLVDDVCRLVELNPVAWEGVRLDRRDVIERCKKNSLVAVHGAIYDIYAEHRKALNWCCKSLANINYVNDIEDYFNKPKYIYLYRDGRDVALSFQKAVVGEKHIYNIAKEWTETQELAIKLRQCIDPNRFFSISYEELTMQPVVSAMSLCEFLDMEYTEKMLSFHETNEAKNAAASSKLWSNVANPVMKGNSKKYKKEMNFVDIQVFESIAGNVLDQLGYERDYINKGEEYEFTKEEIDEFNNNNKRMKMEALLRVDKDDLERRQRQSKLLDKIKARRAA
ncbi:MAG: sulfotransferase [Gammaproteobacteria bacterium]|nr:sulfotransferase [Gammaproteobacteria bacterium]